jgi:hypothetical protein
MKKLLFFLLFCGIILSCGKTDLPAPMGNVTSTPNISGNPTTTDPTQIKIVELTGPIFVNGLPLLKRVDDSVNGITEYFYDEFKREVRVTNSKSPISETTYKYNGDLRIEANFTKNPNYVSQNPQMTFNTAPQFLEHDNQNRMIARTSTISKNFYAYNDADNTIQESVRSFIETNPQTRPTSGYKFDKKGNLIEFTQEGQINEYTFDDKIKPNSFNPSSNSAYPGGMSKSNVLTARVTGGWFGNSYVTYKYTYNKYNLPVTSTSDKGDVITYTYYE